MIPPEQLVNECEASHIQTRTRKRIQLKFTENTLTEHVAPLPGNYSLQKMTGENFGYLSVFDLDIANKFWSSKEDFLNNGFGFFICTENKEPVSICYTACVANNEAEIDVATVKPWQQKG